MALAQDRPGSFEAAIDLARKTLSRNPELVRRNVIAIEAEQIVQAAYRKAAGKALSRAELYLRIKNPFPAAAAEAVLLMATGRAEGKPLQYLIGYQQFLDHEYSVSWEVLIPRPETEILVTAAAEEIGHRDFSLGIEIGLGSGAISIELLMKFIGLRIFGSEVSDGAMACARQNAKKILGPKDVDRLTILKSRSPTDLWSAFQAALPEGGADFIISNPPYLDPSDPIDKDVLDHEPKIALFPDSKDPNFFYGSIADEAKKFLKPGGFAFLEIPHPRADAIRDIFDRQGWKAKVLKDLTGRDRVLVAESLTGSASAGGIRRG